jgi:AcrR family transcriptional regulator
VRDPETTRRSILDAAAAEFLSEGFGGASMQRIARRAGVSTRTLYRVADGKEALFRVVVDHRIARFTEGLSGAMAARPYAPQDLRPLGRIYGRFILSAETATTVRILLEEQGRFPDLVALLQEVSQHLSDLFEAQVAAILSIGTADREAAAFKALLLRLVFLGEQRQQILRLGTVRTEAEIEHFVDRVVTYFTG